MANSTKLMIVKTLHTLIWSVMAAAAFYILYAGVVGTTSAVLWAAIGLLAVETLVLLLNKWVCPLTPMAMRYASDRQANFDIFLPLFIAKHNKWIFGSIFVIGLLLVVMNLLN